MTALISLQRPRLDARHGQSARLANDLRPLLSLLQSPPSEARYHCSSYTMLIAKYASLNCHLQMRGSGRAMFVICMRPHGEGLNGLVNVKLMSLRGFKSSLISYFFKFEPCL